MLSLTLPARNSAVDFTDRGYVIEDFVGKGQFGTAYRVRATSDNTTWLAKSIDLGALDEKDKLLSLQEAGVMQTLHHPRIVTWRESFVHHNMFLVIIMEFCGQGDLASKLQTMARNKETFSEAQVIRWITQLAEALHYIHSKNIVHRDLKPSNIFLTETGDVKVGDFGISWVFTATLPLACTAVGTPQYMAPELCESKPHTFKSDIWAIGCIAYEIATLRTAFEAETILGLVWVITSKEPSRLPAHYSAELQALLDALLAKDPHARPTASTLLSHPLVRQQRLHDALQRILHAPDCDNNDPWNTECFVSCDDTYSSIAAALQGGGLRSKSPNAVAVPSICSSAFQLQQYHLVMSRLQKAYEASQTTEHPETVFGYHAADPMTFSNLKAIATRVRAEVSERELELVYDRLCLSTTTSIAGFRETLSHPQWATASLQGRATAKQLLESSTPGMHKTLKAGFRLFDTAQTGAVSYKAFRAVLHVVLPDISVSALNFLYQFAPKSYNGDVLYRIFLERELFNSVSFSPENVEEENPHDDNVPSSSSNASTCFTQHGSHVETVSLDGESAFGSTESLTVSTVDTNDPPENDARLNDCPHSIKDDHIKRQVSASAAPEAVTMSEASLVMESSMPSLTWTNQHSSDSILIDMTLAASADVEQHHTPTSYNSSLHGKLLPYTRESRKTPHAGYPRENNAHDNRTLYSGDVFVTEQKMLMHTVVQESHGATPNQTAHSNVTQSPLFLTPIGEDEKSDDSAVLAAKIKNFSLSTYSHPLVAYIRRSRDNNYSSRFAHDTSWPPELSEEQLPVCDKGDSCRQLANSDAFTHMARSDLSTAATASVSPISSPGSRGVIVDLFRSLGAAFSGLCFREKSVRRSDPASDITKASLRQETSVGFSETSSSSSQPCKLYLPFPTNPDAFQKLNDSESLGCLGCSPAFEHTTSPRWGTPVDGGSQKSSASSFVHYSLSSSPCCSSPRKTTSALLSPMFYEDTQHEVDKLFRSPQWLPTPFADHRASCSSSLLLDSSSQDEGGLRRSNVMQRTPVNYHGRAVEARVEAALSIQLLLHHLQAERAASCRAISALASKILGDNEACVDKALSRLLEVRRRSDDTMGSTTRTLMVSFHAQRALLGRGSAKEGPAFTVLLRDGCLLLRDVCGTLSRHRDALDGISNAVVHHGTGDMSPWGASPCSAKGRNILRSFLDVAGTWNARFLYVTEDLTRNISRLLHWASGLVSAVKNSPMRCYQGLNQLKELLSSQIAFFASRHPSEHLKTHWDAARLFMGLVVARKAMSASLGARVLRYETTTENGPLETRLSQLEAVLLHTTDVEDITTWTKTVSTILTKLQTAAVEHLTRLRAEFHVQTCAVVYSPSAPFMSCSCCYSHKRGHLLNQRRRSSLPQGLFSKKHDPSTTDRVESLQIEKIYK